MTKSKKIEEIKSLLAGVKPKKDFRDNRYLAYTNLDKKGTYRLVDRHDENFSKIITKKELEKLDNVQSIIITDGDTFPGVNHIVFK
jgi:hypothetical protein